MSAVTTGTQLASPDRTTLPVGTSHLSALRTSRLPILQNNHVYSPVTSWRVPPVLAGRFRRQGYVARPLQLQVLARDVPQGVGPSSSVLTSVTGPEIIVLGLNREALVTATPVEEYVDAAKSTVPSFADDLIESDAKDISLQSEALMPDGPVLRLEAAEPLSPGSQPGQRTNTADDASTSDERAAPNALISWSSLSPATSPTGLSSPELSSPFFGRQDPTSVTASATHAGSEYVTTQASLAVAAPALAASAATAAAASGGVPSSSAAANISPATAAADASAATSSPHPPQEQLQEQQPGLWQRLQGALKGIQWGKLWALTLLSVSYIHQATTGFALPAMLPMISNDLHLTDLQGAMLTTGYSYLYAVALVPIGLLADRVSRPKLLAAGLVLWSILTCTASSCRSFGELILARVGFAAAQGAQNPVCFSFIPELFPVNKSTALSLYNCAIYVGRALSFAAVLLARHLHDNDQAHVAARGGLRMETRLDHLDRADLHSMSIMHTAGEMAAATPDREFNFPPWEYGSELPDSAWRQVLRWIAIPGFLIGLAMMLTLQEPRQQALQAAASAAATAAAAQPQPQPTAVTSAKPAAIGGVAAAAAAAGAAPPPLAATEPDGKPSTIALTASTSAAKPVEKEQDKAGSSASGVGALLRSPGFMSVTLAAALNDVGSYALIAWQSTFYERVYGLESSAYAPVLAILLPIGGILGGVGGGYLADRLSREGKRWWVTAGATCLAAPCLAASCLAPSPEISYAALMVGFGLSEMWRAPAAVMARGIAPASMGSTASALYLCIRNLLGGLGPLMVAGLIGVCGLQQAMLVVPAMYLGSGLIFSKAEQLYIAEMQAKAKAEVEAA